MTVTKRRIYLSSPHMSGLEESVIANAFATNWIAPLGPHVDAFEQEFCGLVGASAAVALSSGTAALHLALIVAGVRPGDEVVVSTLTFAASVNPIIYLGARPVFIDSERTSWNMDPELLSTFLTQRAREGRLPAAVIVVHLYGQSADLSPILAVCARLRRPPDRGCGRGARRQLSRTVARHRWQHWASIPSTATRSSPPRAAECSSRATRR